MSTLMICTARTVLPDGRSFELTLEPVFDRVGYKVKNFLVHAIEEKPQQQTEPDTTQREFWFDRT